MTISGEIDYIIYQNEDFKVIEIKTDYGAEKASGILPILDVGDFVELDGEFENTKYYGETFKIQKFKRVYPSTLKALKRYLASGKIKSIGKATALKIVEKFQLDTLDVIKNDPEKLSTIKGISKSKAYQIQEDFLSKEVLWELVDFLDIFDLGPKYCSRVLEKLGDNAIEKIKNNPYELLSISSSVDFAKVDEIAQSLGIAQNSCIRIYSGITYILEKALNMGHCFLYEEDLKSQLETLLKISPKDSELFISDLIADLKLKTKNIDGKSCIYLLNVYYAESFIARKLIKLKNEKSKLYIKNIDKKIKNIEFNDSITLSEKQKEAIKIVNDNNVVIITRRPGTGKSTIVKSILDLYNNKKVKITLCAPTGRAAKRITEITGYDSSTLHRLLEIGKIDDEGIKYDYTVDAIDSDIIIVDEVSMVDLFLLKYLLEAVYNNTKIIFVGDVDQLNSVGPGNVLKDMIDSGIIPTVKLNKVFRQAAKSKIIQNAHRVNNGKMILSNKDIKNEENDEYNQDCYYLDINDKTKILDQILSLSKTRLSTIGYNFMEDIQILTPTKKGMFGVANLNLKLQEVVNPQSDEKKQIKKQDTIFRLGDRVMQTKNNYKIEWERYGYKDSGIFNGEIGIITDIDFQDEQLEVTFEDQKVAKYEFKQLDELSLSYAITIHKSQGSEYNVVILVISDINTFLLNRNILYTGITRAKKLLIIISNDRIIKFMINNIDSKKRNTSLSEFIKFYNDEETYYIQSFSNIKESIKNIEDKQQINKQQIDKQEIDKQQIEEEK